MTALEYTAVAYARAGWPVFPLTPRGKEPLIPKKAGGRGMLDGTTDVEQVAAWWDKYPRANIGARIPDSLFLVDLDPRHGSDETVAALESEHGPLPTTLTALTGSGGLHLWFLAPAVELRQSAGILGPGIDTRSPGSGYAVMSPSIHPKTGEAYRWLVKADPAPLPSWIVDKLRPPDDVAPQPKPSSAARIIDGTARPGDRLSAAISWAEVLEPHGWRLLYERGAVGHWTRPGKRRRTVSATTNALGTDRLHVFSTCAAPFAADESYTKFGAWALLNYGGDFVSAARALREAS